jgi:hypothetical protein
LNRGRKAVQHIRALGICCGESTLRTGLDDGALSGVGSRLQSYEKRDVMQFGDYEEEVEVLLAAHLPASVVAVRF